MGTERCGKNGLKVERCSDLRVCERVRGRGIERDVWFWGDILSRLVPIFNQCGVEGVSGGEAGREVGIKRDGRASILET